MQTRYLHLLYKKKNYYAGPPDLGWGGAQVLSLCFKLGGKARLYNFLRLFNKIILKQQYAENAAKSAEIDVSELLK